MPTAYLVTWKKKPFPLPFLLDFDDENLAMRCGITLNELGRYDVSITRAEYEPDTEALARMKKRIDDRIAHEWAIGMMAS